MDQTYNSLCREALAFTEKLMELYFVQRDYASLPAYMDPQISWIGTGADEISRNLEEAGLALTQEIKEYDGTFVIENRCLNVVQYSDDVCLVYGTLHTIPEDPNLAEGNMRISLLVEKKKDEIKLVHLHLSNPDLDQEQGHYYVKRSVRSNNQDLRRTLELRSRQLDTLNRNIPGGAHQCKDDPNFTILSMSDGFISMFGYTRKEIGELFSNHFIEMVYPGDRATLLAAVNDQLKQGSDIEVEYRVLCKSGEPVWVLDKGRLLEDSDGKRNLYCLLIEISERKQAQEELRLSLERYQVIMDQATDIIFEWDIRKDTLHFSSNWYKKFGYAPIDQQISEKIPLSRNIHPEDMVAFIKIMKDTAAGEPYSETEFRIKNVAGSYCWCRIRATAQFDSDERPIKAVGVIVDIDQEKRQKQQLLDMAQKDALTGLYNKETTNTLVERRMKEKDSSFNQALFILDVDYFKAVNDTYGHLVGDSILSKVAAVIKAHIRNTDIAGRIGGDEFLVYLTEVTDEVAVALKAEKLMAALELLTPEQGAPPITCSAGVAVLPHGTIDYYTLFKCADQALYVRKKSGRKGITFYKPDSNEEPHCATKEPITREEAGLEEGAFLNEVLAQYVFRKLYAAKDIESTINRLLEIIGRSYDVSRAYIFESSADGTCCSNTFEWCAEGVESQISVLKNISYIDELDDYIKNFDSNGLFYCAKVDKAPLILQNILKPQGIRSMLQCAMLDEGEFVGYVGFDECRENRTWSPKQVTSFKMTADVLSVFLVKLRQKQLQQSSPNNQKE